MRRIPKRSLAPGQTYVPPTKMLNPRIVLAPDLVFDLVLCGLGLGSKPGLGLGFYGLRPIKSQAGQQGSGWARAEPGLDPGLGRLAICDHVI